MPAVFRYVAEMNGPVSVSAAVVCSIRLNICCHDMVKNAILIPAKGIKIQTNSDDDDDDENENSNSKYSKSKPQYMTFKKRAMKNLHYLI